MVSDVYEKLDSTDTSVPPLAIALWAIRERMEEDPDITLNFVKNQKFSGVELAGFYNLKIDYLEKYLSNRQIQVCGVHGPSIDLKRGNQEFIDWAKEFTSLFKTKYFGIESLPSLIQSVPISYAASKYPRIVKSLREIATALSPEILVSYHCFTEDFYVVEGKPLVARLFEGDPVPNLGLQLDTFWLHRAGVDINTIIDLPIHSVHLNVRDNDGYCCLLNEHPEKCYDYVKAIAKASREKGKEILWILESDSCKDLQVLNNLQFAIIKKCAKNWPTFWASINSDAENVKVQSTKQSASTPSQTTPIIVTDPHEETKELSKLYQAEIKESITEHLFWEEDRSDLPFLPIDDKKVNDLYVTKRKSRADSLGVPLKTFENEEEFYLKFWNREGEQLVLLEGGLGAGKTTMLRFVLQYYLPHRETLHARLSDPNAIGVMDEEQQNAAFRHLILYADLRYPKDSIDIKIESQVFTKLKKSLSETIEKRGIIGIPKDKEADKKGDREWVMRRIRWITTQNENEERKWYVSLCLDNSDQLDEKEQRQVLGLIRGLIPEERLNIFAVLPVEEDDVNSRMFWRIILPIRRETFENLKPLIDPIHNSQKFVLKPLDFDDFTCKRGNFLYDIVISSKRYLNVNVVFDPERDRFDLHLPREVANTLRNAWLAVSRTDNDKAETISEHAHDVLDSLCGDSARRRLVILSRATSSRSFIERLKLAKDKQWEPPLVSDFYFFDGLICGGSDHFEPGNQQYPVLNLYNLGANPGTHYSMFIGLHSFLLLKQGLDWRDIRSILQALGYPDLDIECCKRKMVNAEILKPLWIAGKYMAELSNILGHWKLLKEKAYTDNMAVHCALEWSKPQMATITNPSDYEKLPVRFEGSLNLMKKLGEAENYIYTHRSDASAQPGRIEDLKTATLKLRDKEFKTITAYVTKEYLEIEKLTSHENIKKTIEKTITGKEKWDTCVTECRKLVEDSDKEIDVTEAR